jgi:hypothetical protein
MNTARFPINNKKKCYTFPIHGLGVNLHHLVDNFVQAVSSIATLHNGAKRYMQNGYVEKGFDVACMGDLCAGRGLEQSGGLEETLLSLCGQEAQQNTWR